MAFLAALVLCVFVTVATAQRARAFGFEDVDLRARRLAAAPYREAKDDLPAELRGLVYDHYRDIRFKPEKALWRGAGLPFEAAFFHRGGYFGPAVRINEIAGAAVREIAFDPALFDYGANRFDPARLAGLGFAGFRLHFPVNRPGYKDEVLVFLGASYFRAIGRGQDYGASARGLAVDTAAAGGEEFPRFVEFWLQRPAPGDRRLTVYGLLDSPRLAGAYRFVLEPGRETVMAVKARLHLRQRVGLLGLAPLTSMFLFGENQPTAGEDYRPEVHDSDGLSIHAADGEWLWRPLVNPRRLLVTSFALDNPRGFGLMQRDRDFSHYEDLEAHYQRRPSVWVEPRGGWGKGRVELVQIPAPDETNDNVVAYWVPAASPGAGASLEFDYRLRWQKEGETRPPHGWVVQSRRGRGYVRQKDGSLAFSVDFAGPALARLAPDRAAAQSATPAAIVSADANGRILEHNVQRNPATGGWRLALRLRRVDDGKPLELRAALGDGHGKDLTETWSYILPPD